MEHASGTLFVVGLAVLVLTGCGSTATVTTTRTVARAASTSAVVYVPESGGRLLYKPDSIVTGVSGGTIFFDRWLSYGKSSAKARARFEFNSCDPDCAGGTYSYVKATVMLSPIVPCRGTLIYETLAVISSEDESRVEIGQPVDLVSLCREGQGQP